MNRKCIVSFFAVFCLCGAKASDKKELLVDNNVSKVSLRLVCATNPQSLCFNIINLVNIGAINGITSKFRVCFYSLASTQ